jgi:predicted CopG family antitoxin
MKTIQLRDETYRMLSKLKEIKKPEALMKSSLNF